MGVTGLDVGLLVGSVASAATVMGIGACGCGCCVGLGVFACTDGAGASVALTPTSMLVGVKIGCDVGPVTDVLDEVSSDSRFC